MVSKMSPSPADPPPLQSMNLTGPMIQGLTPSVFPSLVEIDLSMNLLTGVKQGHLTGGGGGRPGGVEGLHASIAVGAWCVGAAAGRAGGAGWGGGG